MHALKPQQLCLALLLQILSPFLIALEQTKNLEDNKQAKPSDTEKAELIIFRKKFSPPLAYKPMIKINDKHAFYLPRGHHAKLELAPGKYTVVSDWKPLHGPTDTTIDIELEAGKSTWLKVGSSINIFSAGVNFNSSVSESDDNTVDLSKSNPVKRWHTDWAPKQSGLSGEVRHDKYDVSINTSKVLLDLEQANKAEQTEIYKYLISHHFYYEEILIHAEEVILESHQTELQTEIEEQWAAFMCKYLASSTWPEYKETLITAWKGTRNKKLKRYLKKFLIRYYGFDVKTISM